MVTFTIRFLKTCLFVQSFSRLLLRPAQSISSTTTVSIVWILACLGIIYQLLFHEMYRFLETCIYIGVGLFPAIVIIDMVKKIEYE